MARRTALALVRPRPVQADRPALRRALVLAAALAGALVLLYLGARRTPVFAVRTIEVTGGPPAVLGAVRTAAEPVAGRSLVGLDGDALVRDLEALPSVRSVSYDRAFPSTLRIFVQPERPLAVVRLGADRWVVSERGRVIRRASGASERLPRFRLRGRLGAQAGSFLTDPAARVLLRALALVPRRFPAQIEVVRFGLGRLTFALRTRSARPELRLGAPVDVGVKLAVAALVLRSLPADERPSVGYVDVSLPERVVVG